MPRRLADPLLALLFAALAVAQALAWPVVSRPGGIALALVATLPIAFRRSHPVAAALVGSAVWFVPTDYVALGYAPAVVLFYSLAAYVEDVQAVVATTAFGLAAAITGGFVASEPASRYLGAAAAVLVPALGGRIVWLERRQAGELRALRAEQEALRERAATVEALEQRARIAQELYAAVERVGGPHPGVAQLPALIERARAAGMPVTLHVEGRPRHVSAGVDLSAFRIVQEALNNIHRNARGAPAAVHMEWALHTLSLHVRDVGGAGAAPDADGLVAMRERVDLLGGELTGGRLPGGGFAITAILPL